MRKLSEYLIEKEDTVNEGLPVLAPLIPGMATSVLRSAMMKIGSALLSPAGLATAMLGFIVYPLIKKNMVFYRFNKLNKKLSNDPDLQKLILLISGKDFKFIDDCFKKISKDKEFQAVLKEEDPDMSVLHEHLNRVLGEKDYLEYLEINKRYLQEYPNVFVKLKKTIVDYGYFKK